MHVHIYITLHLTTRSLMKGRQIRFVTFVQKDKVE